MLSADTSRVDGPLHAIYCLDGSMLVAGEELCGQNLSEQGAFPETMRNGQFKRSHGKSCGLSFIGQHQINISAGKGNVWSR